jgi:hypothetical protein
MDDVNYFQITGICRSRPEMKVAHAHASGKGCVKERPGRAAELAGVPLGQMMTILTEFGVDSRIEDEDYLQGLAVLRKAW